MNTPISNPSFAPQRGLRVRREAAMLAQATIAAVEAMPGGVRGRFAEQMRRAAASIHANLAEGEGRPTKRDRLRFFHVPAPLRPRAPSSPAPFVPGASPSNPAVPSGRNVPG